MPIGYFLLFFPGSQTTASRQAPHSYSYSFIFIILSFSPQTITEINLAFNHIGPEGAQHVANALQQNQVSSVVLSHFAMHTVNIDTYFNTPRL